MLFIAADAVSERKGVAENIHDWEISDDLWLFWHTVGLTDERACQNDMTCVVMVKTRWRW